MLFSPSFLKKHKLPLLLAIVSTLLYWCFAYNLVRTAYTKLIVLYVLLFVAFYQLIKHLKHHPKTLTYLAFGFRAIFILAIPNLSQDFYRFIWDGRLILEGINPYLRTVASYISSGQFPVAQALELCEGMGALNASHYTNYPPINQLCFVIAGVFANKSILGSVVVMRLLIIAADFGTLHFGKKLLKKLKLPAHQIFLYVLNPFIIIELTGNLHFEGVMIFFLVWSFYLLYSGKWQWAGVVLALSISVKLIPLIFLPLFYQWFLKQNTNFSNHKTSKQANRNKALKWMPTVSGITNLSLFYFIILGTIALLFAPFYSSAFINNYAQTVALWFQNFEFNASIYYIARAIGYWFRGYNEIAIIGKITPVVVIIVILIITFFRKNKTIIELITAMLMVLSFYYFTTTTVHPWYVATLLILSVFTKYKFPLVWSFVIILSYLAYINLNKADKSENLWVIAIEYTVVYGVFLWEILFKKRQAN